MYLDGSTEALKIPFACEGVVDDNQGRFTSFTALATRGAFGYVGTSGRDENCEGCEHRSACIFMFGLDFLDGDSPTAVIVLNGGDGGLGEKDVWSTAVQPDATDSNSGFVYFAVGSRLMPRRAELSRLRLRERHRDDMRDGMFQTSRHLLGIHATRRLGACS